MDTLRSHTLLIPHLCHLIGASHLNGNLLSGWCVHINGGCGRAHIEGNPIMLCQNRHAAGSDLIGRITVHCNPVTAHENNIYLSGLH